MTKGRSPREEFLFRAVLLMGPWIVLYTVSRGLLPFDRTVNVVIAVVSAVVGLVTLLYFGTR